ncbi:5854_t:CDS:1, partial [Gigaspora rosea]
VNRLMKKIEQWKAKKGVRKPRLYYECWKPGHLAETCPNRKSQRLGDCKVKDEDPNALLVGVQHMKLAGKIVDSVEVNNQNSWKHKRSDIIMNRPTW